MEMERLRARGTVWVFPIGSRVYGYVETPFYLTATNDD